MDFIWEKLIVFGGIPIILLIIGYLSGRFLKPWIHKCPARLARAQEIALIADRITDEMVLLFPNAKWDNWVNDAIDKLIDATDLKKNPSGRNIARREVMSQILKKHGNGKNVG